MTTVDNGYKYYFKLYLISYFTKLKLALHNPLFKYFIELKLVLYNPLSKFHEIKISFIQSII